MKFPCRMGNFREIIKLLWACDSAFFFRLTDSTASFIGLTCLCQTRYQRIWHISGNTIDRIFTRHSYSNEIFRILLRKLFGQRQEIRKIIGRLSTSRFLRAKTYLRRGRARSVSFVSARTRFTVSASSVPRQHALRRLTPPHVGRQATAPESDNFHVIHGNCQARELTISELNEIQWLISVRLRKSSGL